MPAHRKSSGCYSWLSPTTGESFARSCRTHLRQHAGIAAESKKNELRPWKKQRYCIPEKDTARFIAQMDEAVVELQADVVSSLAIKPGQEVKEDYHYERNGTRPVFLFIDPYRGWQRVKSYAHRNRIEWAHEIRHVLDVEYPNVRKVKLVCDNLNTHHIGSLYEAFSPEEAHRLARRLEIHYTPRNGSWLNIAEIELSVLHQ